MPKFNVMENYLVPRHSIMSEKEVKEVLEKLIIQKSQLPQIPIIDPCVKALGAKPGDIIRIERESPTAGTSFYYRVVVEEWLMVDQ
jgi:DNA-directed RNA polymerase subunit H